MLGFWGLGVLGFRVLGFRVWGLGFRASTTWLREVAVELEAVESKPI